jgi:hypothetical protein
MLPTSSRLHCAPEQAVKLGLIIQKMRYASIPTKVPSKEMKILDESQASQLLVEAHHCHFEALLHLALTTGTRQMEILRLNCDTQKPPQVGVFEWAEQDSNLRPPLCKRGALTN